LSRPKAAGEPESLPEGRPRRSAARPAGARPAAASGGRCQGRQRRCV